MLVLSAGAVQAKTYKIGVLMPLTGPSAKKGIPMKDAVELFVEEFNKDSSKHNGTRLELVVRDDFDDPEKAKEAASEMVKDESLLAVIGHYYPETAVATAKIFHDAKIPLISPYVASKEMSDMSKWAYSLYVTEEVEGSFLAVYTKEVLKKDNVLLIYNTGMRGETLKQAFLDKAARIGLTVAQVLSAEREPQDKDWAAKNLPDVKENAKIGIVAALIRSETGVELLPQLRAQGIQAPVISTQSWTSEKFLAMDAKLTKDVFVASPFTWEIANVQASVFRKSFEKKFKFSPTVPNALAYDAALLLAKAIEALDVPGSKTPPSRAGIRDFLDNLDWHDAVEGITGMLYFQNKNDHTASYVAKYQEELKKQVAAAGSAIPVAPAADSSKAPGVTKGSSHQDGPDRNKTLDRDLFVSAIEHGRLKVAPLQLTKPREEYILKELAERVKKGHITVVDNTPYHLIDVVFVGVDIVRINDVNIKEMQWDVDVFMWFKWAGDRLDVKEIEKIGAINCVKEQSALLKEDLSRPTKYRACKKRLTLTSPFDLSDFPFDSQTLRLQIAHLNKNSTHIMLALDSRHMEKSLITDIKPQEWTCRGRDFYTELYRYDSTFGDPDYRMGTGYKSPIYFSTVNLNVDIKRLLQPYIFTFFLPLIIILGIILLILWVPLDQFAPRINASISGLVGVLVYHMSQKNSFPKVGYTMFADYYFLIAYLFVITMILCIIKVQMMVAAGKKEEAKIVNRRLAIGAMVASTATFVFMTLWAIYF